MNKPVKPPVPRMEISEFYDLLNAHTWSFEANSYYEFAQFSKRERELEAIAWTNGPYFVECYMRELKSELNNKYSNGYTEGYNKAKSTYEGMINTGDTEFDAFRNMVRNHDFWYSYSDDGNVYRNGEARRQEILGIVKDKQGIYKAYWSHYVDQQNKASEKAIRESKGEA